MTEFNPQKLLEELAYKIAVRYENLKKDFPSWKENDTRLSVYSRNANLIECILFSVIFKNEQLTDKNWYDKISYIQTPTDSQLYRTYSNYELNLRVWLVTGYLSSVETFFRLLIKQINPELEKAESYKIINKILEKYGLNQYKQNFDFYRFIRNSLHNNGIITDKFAYSMMFCGVFYEIKIGKPITVNWLMLCQLTLELDECLEKIIRSKELSSMDTMNDPSFF